MFSGDFQNLQQSNFSFLSFNCSGMKVRLGGPFSKIPRKVSTVICPAILLGIFPEISSMILLEISVKVL